PLLTSPVTGEWPTDPLGSRRPDVEAGARLVRDALGFREPDAPGDDPEHDPEGWLRDALMLLAERAAASVPPSAVDVPLPPALSVSGPVAVAEDPAQSARRIRRPMPHARSPQARRGTAFHAWLERYFGGEPLLDLAELPGA